MLASPQKENGYTPIAHEILEQIAKIKLSPTQYRLIFVIWRYTYGFKRKEHDMSLKFLNHATGCDQRQIQRELKWLEEKKIIIQKIKTGSYRKISFNKNYEEWIGKTDIGEIAIGETDNGEIVNTGVGETDNGTIGETVKATIGETDNQDIYIDNFKDNFIENNNNNNSTSQIISFWDDNGFGINNINAKNQLLKYMDEGYPPEMLLESLKIASERNARNIRFINGIFRNWKDAGIKSIEQIKEQGKAAKKKSIFEQGEESKKRQSSIKPLSKYERERINQWEEELPF